MFDNTSVTSFHAESNAYSIIAIRMYDYILNNWQIFIKLEWGCNVKGRMYLVETLLI
jgi:hypothetical protein